MKALSMVSLLLIVLVANAQTPKRTSGQARTSAPRPTRKLVETVKAQDGREIHLYDDMTYDVSASLAPASAMVELHIKAGVITNGGDVKAVARTEFIVFSDDIKPVLETLKDHEGKTMDVFRFYMSDEYRLLDDGQAYTAALASLKPSIAGTFTTDFEGNGTIQLPLSQNQYYIYGHFKVGRSACMWYLTFTLGKGSNLVLDNNNAAYCG
ncbi:MAG TPA: hypothetical protein VGO56_19865 [Pyrinomonadaceae bacterium]|jgi:hypothetical protein|nr:hypothetical protein [Pyrinomonadaceae bacterium]